MLKIRWLLSISFSRNILTDDNSLLNFFNSYRSLSNKQILYLFQTQWVNKPHGEFVWWMIPMQNAISYLVFANHQVAVRGSEDRKTGNEKAGKKYFYQRLSSLKLELDVTS